MNFSQLLSPQLSVEQFFDTYWEKRPFHLPRGDPSYYACLFNVTSDLEGLLHNAHHRVMTKQHSSADTLLYFHEKQQVVLNVTPAFAYAVGCSVVVNHADYCCQKVAAACDGLADVFPYVYCNMYLTPTNSATVPPHSDDRDVLLLQIHGDKHWKVWGTTPQYLPFKEEEVGKTRPVPAEVLAEPPVVDVVVRQGDLLYLPRGFVHAAETKGLEGPSLHFTLAIGASHWTIGTLLTESLRVGLRRNVPSLMQFRQSIPLPLHLDSLEYKERVQDLLQKALTTCITEATCGVDSVIAQFLEHIAEQHTLRRYILSQVQRKMTSPVNLSTKICFDTENIAIHSIQELSVTNAPLESLPHVNFAMLFLQRSGSTAEVIVTQRICNIVKELFLSQRAVEVGQLLPGEVVASIMLAVVFLKNQCFRIVRD